MGKSDDSQIFSELVFCILTANYTAKGGLRIQNALDKEIMYLSEEDIAKRLKELGHRFPNTRARYIAKARERLDSILRVVRDADLNCKEKREWLVKNVKGLGLKEASHFLRNIGCLDVAIIDFHIIDLLARYRVLAVRPRTLTRKKYFEIENILEQIAAQHHISLGELDLYLWYLETGEIIK